MFRYLYALLALGAVFTPFQAIGKTFTAGQLLSACTSSDDADRWFCIGFIEGVIGRDQFAKIIDPGTEKIAACVQEVPRQEGVASVIDYLQKNSSTHDVHAATVVLIALKNAFCSEN